MNKTKKATSVGERQGFGQPSATGMRLATLVAFLVSFTATHAAEAETDASCSARITALKAEVAMLEQQWKFRFDALSEQLRALKSAQPASEEPVVTKNVDSRGTTAQSFERRLQTSSPEYVAIESRHVHEFPSGNTCPNYATGEFKTLRPVDGAGVSWAASFAPSVANFSLVSVSNDWSTSEIQSFPAPFKVVHPADCVSPPSLEFQLAATAPSLDVTGAVTAPSIDVTGAVTAVGGIRSASATFSSSGGTSNFYIKCTPSGGLMSNNGGSWTNKDWDFGPGGNSFPGHKRTFLVSVAGRGAFVEFSFTAILLVTATNINAQTATLASYSYTNQGNTRVTAFSGVNDDGSWQINIGGGSGGAGSYSPSLRLIEIGSY